MRLFRVPQSGTKATETEALDSEDLAIKWEPGERIRLNGSLATGGQRHTDIMVELTERDVIGLIAKLMLRNPTSTAILRERIDDAVAQLETVQRQRDEARRAAESRTSPSELLIPSADLALITGADPMTLSTATQRVKEYAVRQHLYCPTERRYILPDDKLAKVLGSRRRISIFQSHKSLRSNLYRHRE